MADEPTVVETEVTTSLPPIEPEEDDKTEGDDGDNDDGADNDEE